MDLQTLKNEYAQENGFPDWEGLQTDFYGTNELEEHMDKICIRAQKAALEKAAENANGSYEDKEVGAYWVSAEGITNPENLIL